MVSYILVWSYIVAYGPLLSSIVFYGLLWCLIVSYDLIQSHMVYYDLLWSPIFLYDRILSHMRRFPEPQHFFAAEWQNWDFAIAIIFYPAIRTLWKLLCILFGCGSTQILNFNAKKNFAKILKIVRKSGFYPIFGQFLKFLQKIFLHWNSKSECYNSQIICTKIFIKFLLQDKKWSRLQNPNFVILQQKNVVAQEISSYRG